MSLLEELADRLHSTAHDLPIDRLAAAADRLRRAMELLRWVRQASVDPGTLPQLSGALEHVERATYALFVTRDAIEAYLAGVGWGGPAAVPDRPADRQTAPAPRAQPGRAEPGWWAARLDELMGASVGPAVSRAEQDAAATTAADLLRRVGRLAADEDRAGLRRELRRVDPAVGLAAGGLAASSLPGLSAQLLGHPPVSADVPRLSTAVGQGFRRLLPGLPPDAVEGQFARACGAAYAPSGAACPADGAVGAALLAALLADRTGADLPAAAQAPHEASAATRRSG